MSKLPDKPFFTYRAWSIAARSSWKVFDETLARALKEAPRHGINCIEIQDYNGSWVDCVARFRRYPKLARLPAFRAQEAVRRDTAARYRRAARQIRRAGHELQVWYHCFRDWPREIFEVAPELRDADGQAVYDLLGDTLRDAFDFFPEITGITVTSLHETPSILRFGGRSTQAARMERLYRAIQRACAAKGRRFILRDFIGVQSQFDDYSRVVDHLPDSVVLQTKDVLADWASHEKPVNPYIIRYAAKSKPLVVEFDLANNFAGELEMPWCDPEQIWRRMRLLGELGIHGVVGRLVNSHSVSAGTIFDTPNEVNVWAFSRLATDPGRLMKAPADCWARDYDQFDGSIWSDWARHRFGARAAVPLIGILQQTPRLVNFTFNLCSGYFQLLRYHKPDQPREEWKHIFAAGYGELASAIHAIRRCGADLARAEKAEAMRIVTDSLRRIERLRRVMPRDGYENVHGSFLRARCLVGIHQALAESLIVALDVEAGRQRRADLARATAALRRVAKKTIAEWGDDLLEGVPRGALAAAEFMDELPGRVSEILRKQVRIVP